MPPLGDLHPAPLTFFGVPAHSVRLKHLLGERFSQFASTHAYRKAGSVARLRVQSGNRDQPLAHACSSTRFRLVAASRISLANDSGRGKLTSVLPRELPVYFGT
jgi:hypothetical protein